MPKEYARPVKETVLPRRLSPPRDVESAPPSDTNFDHLVERFPRELRDLIYFHLVFGDLYLPFVLNEDSIKSPFTSPALSSELLETVFTHRPCHIIFTDPKLLRANQVTTALRGDNLPHRDFIRNLTVRGHEMSYYGDDLERLEQTCTDFEPEVRHEWNELLTLPRLENLTIELHKAHHFYFAFANFSPVIYQLRARNPAVRIKFCVSFDEIIEPEWNRQAQIYAGEEWPDTEPVPEDPYLKMGFVDVSGLIAAPTAEDYEYVKTYLPEERTVRARDIVGGLLDETPGGRRALAEHYLAEEPPLLRVLMKEHYEIYTQTIDGEGTGRIGEVGV